MPPKTPPDKSPITPLHRPGWRDGEDSIPDGVKPKPKPPKDGPEEVTLGWVDEPAAPGDYAEIVRRAASPPHTVVHTMTVEARGDWSSLAAALDGDPVPAELDDAGISLDYDPVEVCSANFAEILGEELYEDDPVEIDADEDLSSVTIGTFTITISTTIRGGAERLARALHALGEALRHNAAEAAPCPDCVSEPCHACIAEEE